MTIPTMARLIMPLQRNTPSAYMPYSESVVFLAVPEIRRDEKVQSDKVHLLAQGNHGREENLQFIGRHLVLILE